jgi:hypothetical protein
MIAVASSQPNKLKAVEAGEGPMSSPPQVAQAHPITHAARATPTVRRCRRAETGDRARARGWSYAAPAAACRLPPAACAVSRRKVSEEELRRRRNSQGRLFLALGSSR